MFKVPEQLRVRAGAYASDKSHGNNGMFRALKGDYMCSEMKGISGLLMIASDGAGWEHVSVSTISKNSAKKRLPLHSEMEFVRHLFWEKTDWVVEFHPPVSEYVNNAPCLHLWRPINKEFPVPPSILVGLK